MFSLLVSTAQALDPSRMPRDYLATEWDVSDGLPTNSIQAITQTSDGYLWVGTADGLARFDGVTFVPFTHAAVPEMVNDTITALCEDHKGRLWIGTDVGVLWHQNGRFSQPTGQWEQLGSVRAFWRDGNDMIVLTSSRLLRYRDGEFDAIRPIDTRRITSMRGLLKAPDGTLWCGGGNALYRLAPDETSVAGAPEGFPDENLRHMVLGPEGEIWAASAKGLAYFKDGKVRILTTADGLAADNVRTLFTDHDGNLWIGTPRGLQRYFKGKFEEVVSRNFDNFGIVLAFSEDREGNLWIGTHAGLIRLRDPKFTSFSRRDGLAHDVALAAIEAKDGSRWVGTWGGGVTRFREGQVQTITKEMGLLDEAVYCLAEDAAGGIWMSYQTAGATRWQDGKLTHFGVAEGLPKDRVRAIATHPDGRVWAGCDRLGLFLYENGRFHKVPTADGPGDRIAALYVDRAGALWVAGAQLWRWEQDHWREFPLRGSFTLAMKEDSRGALWIARKDGGLQRVQDGVVTHFPVAGDSTATVCGIAFHRDEIWLNCRVGVLRAPLRAFDEAAATETRDVRFTSYGESDGMKAGGPTTGGHPTAITLRSGELWFMTNYGVAAIQPDRTRTNDKAPPVVIEKLLLDRKTMPLGDELVLPPSHGELEIRYTGLSLSDSPRVQFRYQLIGRDADWVEAGTRRSATYANVKPGHYTFRVIASNNEGVWNTTGATLALTLKPRFTQTYAFWVLCGIGAVGTLAIAYRWRMRLIERRHRELEALVEERTRDLVKAKDSAEAASRAKSQFLANISHEIRTPMNGVLGMTELATSVATDEEQLSYLHTVRTSGEALLGVINDILDFSKIESGKLTLEASEFSLTECIEQSVEALATRAVEKRLDLVCRIQSELPDTLVGDPGRLRQILLNLLGNALKFTERGEISIHVAQETTRSAGAQARVVLHFHVDDTGIGIAPDKIDRIFESFVQGDATTSRRYGGTGLGLSISRSLVELMGGRIWVESTLGKGSSFHFTAELGRAAAATTVAQKSSSPELAGMRALVVDDTSSVRGAVLEMLRDVGLRTEQATSAQEALALARAGQKFDFVFIDQALTGPDGLEVIAALRAGGLTEPSLQYILLTGAEDPTVLSRARELGLRHFLRKPVLRSRLRERLLAALPGKSKSGSAAPVPLPAAARRMNVLLVEDNPVNQKISRAMLEKAGHVVTLANNGVEAVQAYPKAGYDLVLMDVQMPEMDGIEATRRIRALETQIGRRSRIIALTAHSMKGDSERFLAAGMDAYLGKPIRSADLYAAIDQLG